MSSEEIHGASAEAASGVSVVDQRNHHKRSPAAVAVIPTSPSSTAMPAPD